MRNGYMKPATTLRFAVSMNAGIRVLLFNFEQCTPEDVSNFVLDMIERLVDRFTVYPNISIPWIEM